MNIQNFLLPLRFVLPALLVVFALLGNVYTFWVNIPAVHKQVESEIEGYTAETLNRLQGTLRYMFQQHDQDGVVREVSNLGGIEGYKLLLLFDDQNRINAANRYAFKGQPLARVVAQVNIDQELYRQAKENLPVKLQWSENRQMLVGYYSIPFGLSKYSLRPDRIGVLYVEFDASPRKRRVTQYMTYQIGQISLLSAGLLVVLWIFLHFAVTQRVARLVNVAGRLSEGDLGVRSGLDGRDEIAKIGRAFDMMVSRLALEQSRLQDSERRSRAILDNATDAIITTNQYGIIQSFNCAAEKMLGYQAQDVIGRNVNMLMPESVGSQHDGYLRRYLQTGESRIIGVGREVEARREDGEHVPVELSIAATEFGGEPFFVGMLHDITERKRMERMKSEFVSVVSHELRTPLTAIRGALGLLEGKVAGELSQQAQSLVEMANKNSERLTHLINDLLDIQKIEAGKLRFEMQDLQLAALVEEAMVANQAFASRFEVRLVSIGTLPAVTVRVDAARFQQIMANLISNACKFSLKGGQVDIHAALESAERVRIEVKDYGAGIPEAFRAHIFQKFSQADASSTRTKEGTGLGLAITRELVRHMEGDIGFDTATGVGTTFYFTLPVIQTPRESV